MKWGSQSVSIGLSGTFEAHRSLRCTNEKLQQEKAAKEAMGLKQNKKGHMGGLKCRKGKEEIV